MFYPAEALVPDGLKAEEFLLRPLRATDVELDYDAVVSSRAELLLRSDGRWPREGFTLEENLTDLEQHEREQHERVAFTYTIMNPTATECLGAVYIRPLGKLLKRAGISEECIPDRSAYTNFWVRQSRLADDLDRRLLQALVPWLEEAWAFSQVLFQANRAQARQIQLFEEMDMRLLYTLSKHVLYLPSMASVRDKVYHS